MKKSFLSVFILVCSITAFTQSVVTEENDRVTVRNENDSILVEVEPSGSGAIDASFNAGKSQILVVYSTGKVLVKDAQGNNIVEVAEANATDKAVAAVWSGSTITITTASNQTLSKNSAEWTE